MIKASDFQKSGACSSRSKFKEKSKASKQLDEAIIVKDFCKDIMAEKYVIPKLSDLADEVAASYSDETLDDIDEIQEAYAKRLAKQIWRFGKSYAKEKDKDDKIIIPDDAFIIDLSDKVENDFSGSDEISVRIDALVINTKKRYAKAIVFKRGAAKLGKSAKSYQHPGNDIPMHLMMHVLQNIMNGEIPDGDKTPYNLEACYYYMQKSGDASDKAVFADYFDNDAMIRSLEGSLIKGGQVSRPGNKDGKSIFIPIDDDMLELINAWGKGFDKCDMKEEKDCVDCPDRCICYYALAPQKVETDAVKKKRAKVTPTEEQLAIINARNGVYLCNAVPGSGKTETAIKQRTVSIILDELDEIIKKAEAGEDITEYLKPHAQYLAKDSERVDPLKVKEKEP